MSDEDEGNCFSLLKVELMVLFVWGNVHHNKVFVGEFASGELQRWKVLSPRSCSIFV